MTWVPSHDEPQVPEPAHAVRSADAVCAGPITATHVPTLPTTSQAWHCPLHAELQQTPSTQLLLAHSLPAAHAVPLVFAQCPTEPATLHERPVPVHAASQHTPLAQKPLVQAFAPEHDAPLLSFVVHV